MYEYRDLTDEDIQGLKALGVHIDVKGDRAYEVMSPATGEKR